MKKQQYYIGQVGAYWFWMQFLGTDPVSGWHLVRYQNGHHINDMYTSVATLALPTGD